MNFLLDTTAFSDLMREHPELDVRLETVSPVDRIIICSVVRGEILYGIGRLPEGKRRQNLEAKATKLFRILPCELSQRKQAIFMQ
jgi:predicted nucleic acid-binding protein